MEFFKEEVPENDVLSGIDGVGKGEVLVISVDLEVSAIEHGVKFVEHFNDGQEFFVNGCVAMAQSW